MKSNVPLDPEGHIKLSATNFEKSKDFYCQLFDLLGYKQISDKEKGVAWVTPAGFGIWISPIEVTNHPYKHGAAGLHHLCLKAKSEAEVNKVHSLLVKNDYEILATPKFYPQYTDKYYAVFFADPDGIKLEVAYY